MLRRIIYEVGDETFRTRPGFLKVRSVITPCSNVSGTYHSLLHVTDNTQEHVRISFKPRITFTLPACHPFRDVHHPREEIHEIITRKSSLQHPVHVLFHLVDQGITKFDGVVSVDGREHSGCCCTEMRQCVSRASLYIACMTTNRRRWGSMDPDSWRRPCRR